ncbi:MAG: nucleotidyltransferase domain-containing protein, partial [Anaerolineae bacterium]|jgi:hypothetical protein|nr:nucleotidyltransferase domain-containing protein [Anaerolineae bacterium]
MLPLPNTAIRIPYDELVEFCKRHHLRRMWLFGSVLRDDFDFSSDIDILVEFDPQHSPSWEFYGTWRDELSTIWKHPVDLTTPDSLRSWLKHTIMQTARVIYPVLVNHYPEVTFAM